MVHQSNDRIVPSVLLAMAVALAGCNMGKPHAPSRQQMQDEVAAVLPPFLSLDRIEAEPIATGRETVKVNFKAIVTPKEDLYQVDREVDGTPKVTLIKLVQSAGVKVTLYGFVEASRIMDKWTLETPQIQVGLNQFGNPRGAFTAKSYVTGSDEAATALKQQADNEKIRQREKEAALQQQHVERMAQEKRDEELRKVQEERQAREDKIQKEKQEQARIAFEEQKQKELEQRKKEEEQQKADEDAAHQKLILATVPGTRYIGTISWDDKIQRLRLVVTEQKNFLLSVEVSCPDMLGVKQTFTGQLDFKAEPEKGRTGLVYPITLSPVGKQSFRGNVWNFYEEMGWLKLRMTDVGLDGQARIDYKDYTIRLQREGAR